MWPGRVISTAAVAALTIAGFSALPAWSATSSVAATAVSSGEAARISVPDAATLKNAQKLVNEVYDQEIAEAKTTDDKVLVARKLVQTAGETKNDPAGRYALLCRARDLAAIAGDDETALAAIKQLEKYDIDALSMKLEALTAVARTLSDTDEVESFIKRVNPLIDEALAADRYAIAAQLSKLGTATARAAKDVEALKAAIGRVEEVKEIQKAYGPAKKALDLLAVKPQDPEANLQAGKFLCLMKGDWRKGLPLLARGSDAALKTLAEKSASNPEQAEKQAELADGWWDLSEQEQGVARQHLRQYAAGWYAKAAPHLTGLLRAKAEKRAEAIQDSGREK